MNKLMLIFTLLLFLLSDEEEQPDNIEVFYDEDVSGIKYTVDF